MKKVSFLGIVCVFLMLFYGSAKARDLNEPNLQIGLVHQSAIKGFGFRLSYRSSGKAESFGLEMSYLNSGKDYNLGGVRLESSKALELNVLLYVKKIPLSPFLGVGFLQIESSGLDLSGRGIGGTIVSPQVFVGFGCYADEWFFDGRIGYLIDTDWDSGGEGGSGLPPYYLGICGGILF